MPSPVRFAVVKRLLESRGWTLVRITGSHHHFAKPGEVGHYSIPVHKGQVKHGYYRDLQKDFENQGD